MMQIVRTTITLDPDVASFVQKSMRERGLSFKQVVNEAIRRGMKPDRTGGEQDFPTFDLGEPMLDLTHSLRRAGELEDDELVARLHRGS
jgi:hypothetical protein